jgi:hypothetical protein
MYWLIFLMGSFVASENNLNEYNHEFLQDDTLKTWVAQKFQDPITLAFLKDKLYKQLTGSPNSIAYNVREIVPQADNPYPGTTFYILSDFFLGYLQALYEFGLKGRPSIIEIGVGPGLKFWPILYALTHGGELYANDSSKTVELDFDAQMKECCSEFPDIETTKLFYVNCFFLFKIPSFKNKFHVLFSENVCQMFNPIEHQTFLHLTDYLLQPGGKAFILAETLVCKKADRLDPVFLAYITAKNKRELYPGFLQTKMKAVYDKKLGSRLACEFISSNTPSDVTVKCSYLHFDAQGLVMRDGRELICCQSIDTVNYMTPGIFYNTVKHVNETQRTSLYVKDAFFIDYLGKRHEKFQPNAGINWTAAIIQKDL